MGEKLAVSNTSHQVRCKKVVENREEQGGAKTAVCADMRSNGEKRDVTSIVIFGTFLLPRLYGFSAFVGLRFLLKKVCDIVENICRRVLY